MDKELKAFKADLLLSIRQAKAGEGKAHAPAEIVARRGRPPADVVKVPVKLRLDPDIVETLRASGRGWQTRVNDLLRAEVIDKPHRRQERAGSKGNLASTQRRHASPLASKTVAVMAAKKNARKAV